MSGGRDSLISDLFWTFHGENANKFADVTLVSSDNARFPACRGILAARSAYFASLLFPPDAATPPSSIPVALPSAVLSSVLRYLHTGDIAEVADDDVGNVRALLDVVAAARDMQHVVLHRDLCARLLAAADRDVSVVCVLFEAFFGVRAVGDGRDVLAPLVEHVRRSPAAALQVPSHNHAPPPSAASGGMGGVRLLGATALEVLVRQVVAGEGVVGRPLVDFEFWFRVVAHWTVRDAAGRSGSATTNADMRTSSDEGDDDERDEHTVGRAAAAGTSAGDAKLMPSVTGKDDTDGDEERRVHATHILDLLDSTRMRSAFLLNVVEPTGLMSLHKLCEGYRFHATKGIRQREPAAAAAVAATASAAAVAKRTLFRNWSHSRRA